MKILTCSAVFVLAFASSVSAADASGVLGEKPRASLIVHSGSHPNSVRALHATHHFDLYVGGDALSQLLIDLPDGIRVSEGIEVTDKSGQEIDATVSIKDTKATIAFAKPVPPGTTLSIFIQGVETKDYLGRTWFYLVYGRSVGTRTDRPLGTAQIQTYK